MLSVLHPQKGITHILLVILILIGIGAGIYLVQKQTNLSPKAAGETIQIVDESGNPITSTTSATVRVKLSPSNNVSSLSNQVAESAVSFDRPDVSSSPTPEGFIRVSGRLYNLQYPRTGVEGYIEYCDPTKKGALTRVETGFNGTFSFNIQKAKAFCIKAPLIAGYPTHQAVNARSQDKISYESQIAGVNCASDRSGSCKTAVIKSLDLATDNIFDFAYTPLPTPAYVVSATLAEDPNFSVNTVEISFSQNPVETSYTFTNPSPGNKLIYAKFNLSDGTSQNAIPFPAAVELVSLPTPTPTPTFSPSSSPSPSPSPTPLPTDISIDKTYVEVSVYRPVNNDGTVDMDAINLYAPYPTEWILEQSPDFRNTLYGFVPNTGIITEAGTTIPIKLRMIFDTNNFQRIDNTEYSGSAQLRYKDQNGVWKFGQRVDFKMKLAEPIPPKRVFVTSQNYSGSLGGITGADSKCLQLANAAGLGGKWKAWISSSTVESSPISRFRYFIGLYKQLNGTIIASNRNDLYDGSINPINITELNTVKPNGTQVWTNTRSNGVRTADQEIPMHCNNWSTSLQSQEGKVGIVGSSNHFWTMYSYIACNLNLPLYCFEQ